LRFDAAQVPLPPALVPAGPAPHAGGHIGPAGGAAPPPAASVANPPPDNQRRGPQAQERRHEPENRVCAEVHRHAPGGGAALNSEDPAHRASCSSSQRLRSSPPP